MDIRQALTKLAEQVSLAGDDNLPILLNGAANEIEQLQQRNAELAAQLKKSQHTNYALMTMINRYAAEIARCQRKEGWHDNHPLVEANTMTPTQCLAEHDREVAARVVESAIRSALRTFGNSDLSEDEIKKLASEYSGKVLRGDI